MQLSINSLRRNLHYAIGFLLILISLILKSLFTHNFEYWQAIKIITIFLFCIGFLFVFINFFNTQKPKNRFFKIPMDWVLYYMSNLFFIIFGLMSIFIFEQVGKEINYKLRNYYLSNNVNRVPAIISNFKKLNILNTGEEDFYMVSFVHNNGFLEKGLIVDHVLKDGQNYNEVIISKDDTVFNIDRLVGKKVEIIFSDKFPSFLKITALN